MSGSSLLAFHAVRASLLMAAPRCVLCGGEERGTWLLEHGLASGRTFAFAAALTRERTGAAIGTLGISRDGGGGALGLAPFFDLLRERKAFDGMVAPGWRLRLKWN
jgi:hypothetical protein